MIVSSARRSRMAFCELIPLYKCRGMNGLSEGHSIVSLDLPGNKIAVASSKEMPLHSKAVY